MKLNMLVEIYAGNYDSQDGPVNGEDAIIKSYTKTNKIDFIWINLFGANIGHRQDIHVANIKTNNTININRLYQNKKTISHSIGMCTYNT